VARFRGVVALLLNVFIIALLSSCTTEDHYYISDYDYVIEEEPDSTAENITQAVFTGDPIHRDNLHWQEGRDRDWEVDIRHFAVKALWHHPLLTDYNYANSQGIAGVDYFHFAYKMLLRRAAYRNGIVADDADGIRDSLREIFIDRINELILSIPSLSDSEVKFGLSEVTVLLDDTHTRLHLRPVKVFPVQTLFHYNGVFFAGVPKEIEHALYGELRAINGIDIDEIIERLGEVFPHENQYGLRQTIGTHFLMSKEFLGYINVVDDRGMAYFTIRSVNGEIFGIELQAIYQEDFENIDDAQFVRHEFSILMHMHHDKDFWYEYFYGGNIMYVRINRLRPGVGNDFEEKLRNWTQNERIDKFIIDLRGNPGGREWLLSPDLLESERIRAVYIIIDGGSESASVLTASNLRRSGANVQIVGEPAGQPDNFFAGPVGTLSNSGLGYVISMGMTAQSNSTDITLRPDILIPLTINDIISNRDPVLDYIWER